MDLTDEELERLEAVVVLTCARRHLLLWPANVHPLPDRCLVNADGWDCRSILTRRKTMVPIDALLVSQEKVTELQAELVRQQP